MPRKPRGPRSGAEILAALGAAALLAPFVWSMNNTPEKRRQTVRYFRKGMLERERREKREAAERRAREERRAWFARGAEGDLLFRAETERVFDVLPPYDDIEKIETYSGDPRDRSYTQGYAPLSYGWRSASAKASFRGHYCGISARGQWSLTLDGSVVGGELVHTHPFMLGCPEGSLYLTHAQRTAIRRLLGATGGPGKVVFMRAADDEAIRRRLWREHLAARAA